MKNLFVLREYNEMKEEMKNSENAVEYILYKNKGNILRNSPC